MERSSSDAPLDKAKTQSGNSGRFLVVVTSFRRRLLDEDNSFARWTPCGNVSLTINNPALFGKFSDGQKFYADFTEAAE